MAVEFTWPAPANSCTEDMPAPGPLNLVIRIDDKRIKGHLDRVVRGTVEETLNALLDGKYPVSTAGDRGLAALIKPRC